MPTRAEIGTFASDSQPSGLSPLVGDPGPAPTFVIAEPDPAWARQYDDVAARVREALGFRVLAIDHVGSTSVPGLPAKPVIDIDLVVADPGHEDRYVPALEAHGFDLRIREPWWYGHRLLGLDSPATNLHVWGPESPERLRHLLLRDWLRANPDECELYARAKRDAAAATNAHGEHMMTYNARKQDVVREIAYRALAAAGIFD